MTFCTLHVVQIVKLGCPALGVVDQLPKEAGIKSTFGDLQKFFSASALRQSPRLEQELAQTLSKILSLDR